MKKLSEHWASTLVTLFLIGGISGCTQTKPSETPSVPVANNRVKANQTDNDTNSDKVQNDDKTKQTEPAKDASMTDVKTDQDSKTAQKTTEKATFGAGCFWCVEAVFDQLDGVSSVTSGYTGGELPNPTYEQICTGLTGHAEVIQVAYDPEVISFAKLLEVFWKTHDPTTLNQQGNDVGTQYRSAVFYHNEEQLKQASEYMKKLNDENAFGVPVVTTMEKLGEFFPAENYHQDYFKLNGRDPYCRAVIPPKLDKLHKIFGDILKVKAKDK